MSLKPELDVKLIFPRYVGGPFWTRCPYVATKSPGAILRNAAGVGPKGRGQDARVNHMDVRERRGPIHGPDGTSATFCRR